MIAVVGTATDVLDVEIAGVPGPLRVEREIARQSHLGLRLACLRPGTLRARIGTGLRARQIRDHAARRDRRVGREIRAARIGGAAIAGVHVERVWPALSRLIGRVVGRRPTFEVGTRAAGAIPPLRRLDLGPHLELRAELRLQLRIDVPLVDHVAVAEITEMRRVVSRVAREQRIVRSLLRVRIDVLEPALGLVVPQSVDAE